MRDTRSLIDTRRYQTNKNHIDCNYRIQQHSSGTECLKMNNNENNARFFRTDGQLRHHWVLQMTTLWPLSTQKTNHPKLRNF